MQKRPWSAYFWFYPQSHDWEGNFEKKKWVNTPPHMKVLKEVERERGWKNTRRISGKAWQLRVSLLVPVFDKNTANYVYIHIHVHNKYFLFGFLKKNCFWTGGIKGNQWERAGEFLCTVLSSRGGGGGGESVFQKKWKFLTTFC